ncbi:MAG TPA: hypothetical protein PKD09_09225 [Aggregatilinea sp.]|uniref:hypothetical protein n=1 Tax=Aggregatilinea sp. TaxID=2806333 RepID=UPI002BA3BB48|nr:hypothetical protein [Aggregatilinea sp.]HML21817.1 hypothetical protein [Aggregatilinea sp.]
MADLTISTFNPIFDNAQLPPKMLSAPVAADMTKGTPVKFNADTGKFEKMASTDAAHLFAGLLTKDTKKGYMGVAFRGFAFISDLGTLTLTQLIALSANAGKLANDQTGILIARIVPLHQFGNLGNSVTKMIEIFDLPITIEAAAG